MGPVTPGGERKPTCIRPPKKEAAANDKQQMVPLEAIEEQSGQKPEGVLADNGYCSDENLKYLAKKRMEGFVAVGKQKHSQRREPCKGGSLPREVRHVERMQRKLETKVGAAVHRHANS